MEIKDVIPWNWGKKKESVSKIEAEQPFHELQQRIGGLFDDFYRRMHGSWGGTARLDAGAFSPVIDVSEDKTAVTVVADVPGMSEDEVEVSLSGNTLTIKGEKKQEKEEKGKDTYRLERSFGAFRRDIPIPSEIEEGQVTARYKDGVLTVTLPKKADGGGQKRQIAVNYN